MDLKNSEALIWGDFNMNIMKIDDETHFCDFFDTLLAYSFYPKITFPTRPNHSTVETLYNTVNFCWSTHKRHSIVRARYGVSFLSSKGNILCRLIKIELYKIFAIINRAIKGPHCSRETWIDNIYCRLSSRSVKTTSGIITDPLSDYFPYFMFLDMVTLNPVKSLKKIEKYVNHQSAMANMLSEMTTRDITNEFNKELTLDPNHDYYMLHNHIKELKDKHLPIRYEKFHKHRHKKTNKWITYGILRSIRFRDKLYLKYKRCSQNWAEYHPLKNNLRVFNSILKSTIRNAKIHNYNEVFEENKKNIKATWKYISEIICKSSNQRKMLNKIIVDSNIITDPKEICDQFNEFFVGIGPKLASNINTETKKSFSFFTYRIITSFPFTLVDQKDIFTHFSSLKTSFGIDGISTKFLKFLSPALTKPLSGIINQSLVTGIFPTKLKIA